MASFELFPDPVVTVVEAGIFLTNLVVIKKLILDPYVQLKDKRDAATTGSKDDAVKIVAECETVTNQITEKLSAAAQNAKSMRETIRTEAVKTRDSLLESAEKEAKSTVEKVREEVAKNLSEERGRVSEIVSGLSQEVYKAALS